MEDNLPPGFRFHPTDEELIIHYLIPKVSDVSFTSKAIVDVDLNKNEPWDLPGKASMGEKVWYFFSLRDRKYPTGLRTNRATEAGYWKTTGKDKEIYGAGALVGMKKTLVFYMGRAPKGEKSNWVMHEYRIEHKHPFTPTKEEWAVCRIFKKSTSAAKKPQESQSSHESPCHTTSNMVNEFGDIELLPNLNNMATSSSYPITYNNGTENEINLNMNTNMIMNNINMASVLPLSLSPWTSNLLGTNLSPMNSLLLRAFHLRNAYSNHNNNTNTTYDNPRQVISSNPDYSLLQQEIISRQFASHDLTSKFQDDASSSKVLESLQPPPRQQLPSQQEDHQQQYDLKSMW